jgi:hypothetical protein
MLVNRSPAVGHSGIQKVQLAGIVQTNHSLVGLDLQMLKNHFKSVLDDERNRRT